MLKVVKKDDKLDLSGPKNMVLFTATWCGMCSMFKPVVEEFVSKHDEVVVYSVDVDENRELAREYGVTSIPSYYIIENDKMVDSKVGFIPLPQLEKLVLG
ncbi:thioredoxin family protein [Mycoplasma miroungirhinis]|uniref:Thioredoxin family protein n=1 Tax=Mycoplasma miroungirhinis TaxID=754516 RepID=A0A6M4JAI7_9MOLU|nr:thioredoxin family protein [Mycoplasma miroungirhinis]QJR43910.1 thioredoxin family protein [Mycoplasma miroungirhinis]